ncbi:MULTISPECIES: LlaJI family restriction endonuclease [Providencia]|uniref:LlaJI family restriction endonuclease n=1 Tax=Providencia TaxID=586 RepID=UPI00109C8651|nr:LlaJI family restriction endonuclease [Providencia rettgeri]MBI6194027.1 LlaJI family restriction endonuclease [Providencia rettgeri]THB29740.1 LlaJI family restriction endonuclease [Providencia sp. MGF014]
MVNLEYFLDRDEVNSLPNDLVILMKRRGLITADQTRVHYCGFISWQQGIAVFMPRNSVLKSREPHYAFYLYQALSRYYLGKDTGISEGQESEFIGKTSLSIIHYLIEDYCTNGIYVRRKKHLSINHGRPNWKKSLVRRMPYPSGDSPIYFDIDTDSSSYVSDCETARIHAQVIRHIYKQYGVLFTGSYINFDDNLDRILEPISSTEGQVAILDRELSLSYSERDIRLINMLKAYIEESLAVDGCELLVGSRKFHNVWEGMLDKCLPRKIEINSELPVPYYQQGEYFFEVSKKGQRTDTVIENKNGTRWAIIDAKYYNASTPNLAPGWHDLIKQFFYRTAAEKICGQEISVTLHFIFPDTIQHLHKIKVGARGQKKTTFEAFLEVDGYGEIHCHYCNPITLLEKYACGQLLDINNRDHISSEIFPGLD